MGFTADICIIVILILCIVVGVSRGFVYSAVKFLGAIAAAVLSAMLSTPIATWLFQTFFRTSLLEKVNDALSGSVDLTGVAAVLEQFPEFITQLLAKQGITQQSLLKTIETQQGNAGVLIVDTLAPALIALLEVLVAIVLFMLFLIVVRGVASLISGVFRLPVLDTINKLLGGLTGLLTGILTIWLLLTVLQAISPALSLEAQAAVNRFFDSSVAAKVFQSFNPMTGLFS